LVAALAVERDAADQIDRTRQLVVVGGLGRLVRLVGIGRRHRLVVRIVGRRRVGRLAGIAGRGLAGIAAALGRIGLVRIHRRLARDGARRRARLGRVGVGQRALQVLFAGRSGAGVERFDLGLFDQDVRIDTLG